MWAVVWVALCLGLAEVGSRTFWRFKKVSFRDPGQILYAYYPELWKVENWRPAHDDEFLDILFLGGSVLHPDWGSVQQQLLERLVDFNHRNVRIFNLAVPAHTSRDSWHKYAALSQSRFEWVVFYHGVNEARVNNAPVNVFKEDYSHYAWYEIVNALARYHGVTSFALPYTWRFLTIRARQTILPNRYILEHKPREEWMRYGGNARSVDSFDRNLSAIIEEVALRGDRLLLMTFAFYVPPNYSRERFEEKRLDYVLHLTPLEIWGRAEFVVATISAHNEMIRRKANEHDGVLLVDQALLMGNSPDSFNDPFHLTTAGASRFVENLLVGLLPHLPVADEARTEPRPRE